VFTACGIKHRRCCLPAGSIVGALYHRLSTQSSAPEDGRNYRLKHVELIEIVNKIIIVASSRLFVLLYFNEISHSRVFLNSNEKNSSFITI